MPQPIPDDLLNRPKAPPYVPPGQQPPPPGWYNVPVQADNKAQYIPPPGWSVPGQAPPPTTGQQPAADNYVPPQGWHAPGQQPAAPLLTDAQRQALLALLQTGNAPKGK